MSISSTGLSKHERKRRGHRPKKVQKAPTPDSVAPHAQSDLRAAQHLKVGRHPARTSRAAARAIVESW